MQIDDKFSLKINLFPATTLYVHQSISLTPQTFLSCDSMTISLNIFSQYHIVDNIVILPGYVSTTAKILKECILEGRKLGLKKNLNQIAIKENEKKHHSLYGSLLRRVRKTIRDRLLDKHVIVYVTNPNLDH